MAKKKRPFRFRFSWFSEASAPRPKDESKSREKADTSVPFQESSEKAPAQSPPTQAQEVPIDEHQQHSPSHSHQPDKTFSITIESPRHSLSKPESLPSVPSFPISKTPQPRSPAHSSEESRPTSMESTSQAKEEMLVSEPLPQPEMSPLKTISKPEEIAEPKTSPQVSESLPQPKESPLKTIPKSPEVTQPEISSHVIEPVPQPKDSPLKSIPESQKLTQPESPPHVPESMPQPKEPPFSTIPESPKIIQPLISSDVTELVPQSKDSPLKSISKSQELTQPESPLQVFEPVPQPEDSQLKSISKSQEPTQTSSHVSELVPQPKKSPLTIPKSQELTQLETSSQVSESVSQPEVSSHVSEPIPQLESPSETIPKSQDLAQQETSSHVSEPVPQPKKSPLTTIPKSQEITQPETSSQVSEPEVSSHVSEPMPRLKDSPLETIPKSQDLSQPKTSSPMSKPLPQPKESPSITIPKSPKTSPKNKKFELDSNREDTKSVLEAQRKFHQNEENEKVVHEHTEEGKAKNAMTRRTEAVLHKEASVSGTQTKDSFSKTFRADWQKQDIGESIDRKLMFVASNSSGKDIKVVSSVDPTAKSKLNDFHQMDVLSNRERTPLKKGIREDILKFVQKLEIRQPTDPMEDKPVSAITLAGENRGATMQIGSKLTKKEGSVHIERAYKTDPEESQEVTTDAEEGSNNSVEQDEMGKAYVNSNIQSINNSLMCHDSITEKDPGVHLVLPQKPAEPIHSDDEGSKG